ncbi:MAG: phosphate/phosphite/phosphonate ABC transporter substrate-binding protein [Gammaproteobacteria bacterium]|nr:MAG: phosphate/phosphite/phosphonate ABC transporter substrate-binding protein [Gammaproteobacteria bacterium]
MAFIRGSLRGGSRPRPTDVKILLLTVLLCLTAYAGGTTPEGPPGSTGLPLRIGIFPRMAAERMVDHFRPLAEWLEDRLGRKVELESAPDLHAFWEQLAQGRYDLVHYNQYHYIKARALYGHRVILKNEELGRSVIRSVIVVPADSSIVKVDQLRGRKILFGGGREAMVAFIMAADLLQSHGLPPSDYLQATTLTPVEALRSLYYGQGDAASGGDALLRLDDMPWTDSGEPPRVIALSTPIAHLPWAVTARVSPAEEEQIRNALLALNESPKGRHVLRLARLSGLRAAHDSEYDAARRIVARVLEEHY